MASLLNYINHYHSGLSLYRESKFNEALTELRKSVSLKNDFFDAYYLLGRTFLQLGRYAEAANLFNRLSIILPDDTEIIWEYINLLDKIGDHRNAFEILRKEKNLFKNGLSYNVALAKQLFALGKNLRAKNILKRIINKHPKCFEAYFLLGEIYLKSDNSVLAEEAFANCLEINPNHTGAKRGISVLMRNSGYFDNGDSIIQKVKDESLGDTEGLEEILDEMENGQLSTAIDKLKQKLFINPEMKRAKYYLGLAYEMQKSWAQAAFQFEKLLTENSSDIYSKYHLAKINNNRGKCSDAVNDLNSILENDPDFMEAHFEIAISYHNMDELDKARDHYNKAMTLGMKDPRLSVNMAYIMMKLENFDSARNLLEHAVSDFPDYAEIYWGLGHLAVKENKFNEALESLKHALKLKPSLVPVHKTLALVYYRLNDLESSLNEWQIAQKYNPRDKQIGENINLIQQELKRRTFL